MLKILTALLLVFCVIAPQPASVRASSAATMAMTRENLQRASRDEILKFAAQFKDGGDYESARRCYEMLLERDPGDVRSRLLMGMLYQNQFDDLAKAIAYYRKAAQYISDNDVEAKVYAHRLAAEAYRTLAERRNSVVYYAQAIHQYEEILRLQPENYEVMYFLAAARLNSLHFEGAIETLEELIEKDKDGEWGRDAREMLSKAKSEMRDARRERRRNR